MLLPLSERFGGGAVLALLPGLSPCSLELFLLTEVFLLAAGTSSLERNSLSQMSCRSEDVDVL